LASHSRDASSVKPYSTVTNPRDYPDRPFIAVSAAIIRDGRVLIVRRARVPANGLYTLPGGVVEPGESLLDAVRREVMEETALTIEPVALAGFREAIVRDADGRLKRHFVILPFASRWVAGEPKLNAELDDARWLLPDELGGLSTTDGLSDIVITAFRMLGGS
jgi:ADP-ribose pyrophosphatase YjhB (NUDIX family)